MLNKTRLVVLLIIISLVVILSLPISSSTNIKIKLVDFFSPVVKFSNSLVENIFSFKNIFTAIGENKVLRTEFNKVSSRCNDLEEAFLENQRLKQLLDLRKQILHETIACRVIARDAGTWYKTIILDKGKKQGISAGMPVVNAYGVVGRIIECDDCTSRVLLITDANSSIGGITQDMRIAGLIEGDGTDLCLFNLLSKKEELQLGATVVTSGLSRIFPKGLKIGMITEIMDSDDGLYKIAKVKLSADINKLEEVLVIENYSK
jgi:rod shape-determining protein MreC